MRSLALLMKLQLDGIFRFSEFRYAKSGKAKIAFFLRSLVPLLLAFVLYGVCYYLGQTLSKGGLAGVLPVLGYLLGSLLTLIFTMIKINELLAGDDNALFLLSLPISTFWHVFLIFLRLYVECTILVLLSNIPFLQAYLMAVSVDGGFLGRWIVGLCFTCLPITGIASLAGIFLALILCSVKNSNLLHSMIMLAVLFVMGLLVGNSIGNVSNAVSMHKDQSEIIRAICANYSFGRMYQNGVVENNGAFFFLFLVASSVRFLFFFLFMLVAYQEIVLALRAPKVYKTFSYGTQEAKTKHRALEERLWSQWIHSRSYMVSTLIGPMYALMSSAFCLLREQEIRQFLYADCGRGRVDLVILCLLLALLGMGCSSYCGFSMEGKRHWIMESMPMEEKDMEGLLVKRNLFITIPVAVVSCIFLALAFSFGILESLGFLLCSLAYCLLTAFYGAKIDKKFADYSMLSENQILRQSTSFFLGWLPGVAIPLLLAVGLGIGL